MAQGFDYNSGRIIGGIPRPEPKPLTGNDLVKQIRAGTKK